MESDSISCDTDISNESPTEMSSKTEKDVRPIMNLLQCLTGISASQENTILTNAQIVEIFQKEFLIDVTNLHELQVDIFISVTKKFLKDWPQWEEFDKVINSLKIQNDVSSIRAIIDIKYKELKDYLKVMLDTAKQLSETTIAEVKASDASKPDKVNLNDVVLDVYCTRQQLNELIYRHPHPECNDTIFNINNLAPSRINLNQPSFISILNWFDIRFNLSLSTLIVNRETIHELKHVLVNKKLKSTTTREILSTCIQRKNQLSKGKLVKVAKILSVFENVIADYTNKQDDLAIILTFLYDTLKADLQNVSKVHLQNVYRRPLNKHSYIRQLYTDLKLEQNHENSTKYDLHVEETINPMVQFFIGKADMTLKRKYAMPLDLQVRIECRVCDLKFSYHPAIEQMTSHIMECHMNEPDVTCSNCSKDFNLFQLSHNRWYHNCFESVE